MSLFSSLLKSKDFDAAEKYLLINSDACLESIDGVSPIFYALENFNVSRRLLQIDSSFANQRNSQGLLPIHVVVKNGGSLEMVQSLVDIAPQCLKEKTPDGKLPLHFAVAIHGVDVEHKLNVVEFLTQQWPESAQEPENRNGSLPLHYACACRADTRIVFILLQIFQKGCGWPDKGNNFPLHLAIAFGSSREVVERLIELEPNATREYNSKQRLPIHLAIHHRSHPSIVEKTMHAFPAAISYLDGDGKSPLEVSLCNGSEVEVVRVLLEAWDTFQRNHPKKAMQLMRGSAASNGNNTHENLILYYLEFGSVVHPKILRGLIKRNREALTQRSGDGKLPLHIAAWKQCTPDVVEMLIDAFPGALHEPDTVYGNLPLHYACQYLSPALDLFLSAFGGGAKVKNKAGRLPIHLAVQAGASADTINTLFYALPYSQGVADALGKLPVDLALDQGAPTEMVAILLGQRRFRPRSSTQNGKSREYEEAARMEAMDGERVVGSRRKDSLSKISRLNGNGNGNGGSPGQKRDVDGEGDTMPGIGPLSVETIQRLRRSAGPPLGQPHRLQCEKCGWVQDERLAVSSPSSSSLSPSAANRSKEKGKMQIPTEALCGEVNEVEEVETMLEVDLPPFVVSHGGISAVIAGWQLVLHDAWQSAEALKAKLRQQAAQIESQKLEIHRQSFDIQRQATLLADYEKFMEKKDSRIVLLRNDIVRLKAQMEAEKKQRWARVGESKVAAAVDEDPLRRPLDPLNFL